MEPIDTIKVPELARRLENLIRIGVVEKADYGRARVMARAGKTLTGWLPWLTQRAGNDRAWWAPEVGEQVLVLCPSGDPALGFVLPSLYQSAHPANGDRADLMRVDFADGAFVEYDRKNHAMTLESRGDLRIRAHGKIYVDAQSVHVFE